jgi:hypothetical protein
MQYVGPAYVGHLGSYGQDITGSHSLNYSSCVFSHSSVCRYSIALYFILKISEKNEHSSVSNLPATFYSVYLAGHSTI